MNSISFIIQNAENVIKSIGREKEHLSSEFYEKLTEILEKLEKYKTFTTKTPDELAKRVVHLLNYLDQNLEHLNISPLSAKRIHDRLIRSEKSILKSVKASEAPPTAKVDCRLAFMCDIDAPDHNGAIASFTLDALQSKMAVITTVSLFKEIHNKQKGHLPSASLENYIDAHSSEWRIYQKGEFLIFLPEQLLKEQSDEQALEGFDLDPRSISRIAIDKLHVSGNKASMAGFFALFLHKSSRSKLVWIAGHGGVGNPGGLTREHYAQFLKFIKNQRCLGLTINSCFSGGASSLLHMPENLEDKERINFPVIVRSIGDFPTHAQAPAERNVGLYFDQLEKWIESPGARTTRGFKKVLQVAEEGKTKLPTHLVQVYFPPSKDSPGGFRPIGEGGRSFSLTFGKLRSEQLQAHQFKEPSINVVNKDFLELHPVIIDTPLIFKGRDPLLLSMIPGQAHHYIKEISLAGSIHYFFMNTSKDYKTNQIGVSKGFFVETIKSGANVWHQCVILLQPQGMRIIFRIGDSYFLMEDTGISKRIATFHYMALLHDAVLKTIPDEQGIRTQVGGQQSDRDFYQTISNESFWGPKNNDFLNLKPLFNPSFVSALTDQSFLEFCNTNLSHFMQDDYANLASLLLQHKRTDLIPLLITTGKISPDSVDWDGYPLLVMAAMKNEQEFVRYLLEKGADVNAKHRQSGYTALHVAAKGGNRQLVSCLLNHPKIQPDALDQQGLTPVGYAWRNPRLLTLFKEKGASLNIVDKTGHTVLSRLCFLHPDQKLMKRLLDAGADPNVGYPSPLFGAISRGDVEAVKLLLHYGADPFNQKVGREIDFIEAIIRGHSDMIQLFLAHQNFNPNIHDYKMNVPLNAAIQAIPIELIQVLLERGAKFNYSVPLDVVRVKNAIQRRPEAERDLLIDLLWKYKDVHDSRFQDLIFELYLRKHAKDFVLDGSLPQPQESFIKNSIELACENEEKYGHLLEQLTGRGIDFNEAVGSSFFDKKKPLEIAIEKKKPKVIEWLLYNGADSKPYFSKIIAIGNLPLIAIAVGKGAQVTPHGSYNPLFDVAACDPNGEVIPLMVNLGGELNFIGQHPASPFAKVVEQGNLELVNFCIDHGANIHPLANNKYSPLFSAVRSIVQKKDQRGLIYKTLVKLGADQNSASGCEKFASPFAAVVATGNLPLINWCLKHGAQVNLNEENNKWGIISAYSMAIDTDAKREVFKKLVEAGLKIEGEQGAPIVLGFIKKGDMEFARYCFARGVRLKQEDALNAFKYAFSSTGSFELIKLLDEEGMKFSMRFVNDEDIRKAYNRDGAKLFDFLLLHDFDPGNFPRATSELMQSMIKKDDTSSFEKMLAFPFAVQHMIQNAKNLLDLIDKTSKKEEFLGLLRNSEVGLFLDL